MGRIRVWKSGIVMSGHSRKLDELLVVLDQPSGIGELMVDQHTCALLGGTSVFRVVAHSR
jgi:hypothetical protein